jgi:hypothetical protein
VMDFTNAFCDAATAEPEKKGFFKSIFRRE